jgi:hemolysin activation/secretion protein
MSAQAAPDAGSVLQQIQQNIKTIPSAQDETKAFSRPNVGQAQPGAVTVRVERIDFKGNTLLSQEQLDAAVAPWLKSDLDYSQLRQIAAVVNSAYRDAGWLVRVSLPQQDIRDGVVVMQIVEAKFGAAQVQGNQSRVDPTFIAAYVAQAQSKGQLVASQRIDRALLLLDEIPGLAVSGNLIEGREPGSTDLLLSVGDRAAFSGNVTLDNTGSRSTGTDRLVGSLNINSPLGLGDQLALTALKTQGSNYQRVGYALPVGYDGWRAGAHATNMTYGLVGDFASLNSNGTARTSGLDLTYPLLRSQQTNIRLNASYDAKRFDNQANGASASNYTIDVVNMGATATHTDGWAGGGSNTASVNVYQGSVNLAGSSNQSADTSGAATAGQFSKFVLSFNRLQNITSDLSAYVALNVQRADKNLDSSERLYLGGANGVRAYPGSEAGGSEGQQLTAELRQQLGGGFNVTGFFDVGQVKAFKNNAWANGSGRLNAGTAPNDVTLKGFGVSLAWAPQANTDLRATLARRIGTSPIANTSNGLDADGTLKINRLWLNATFSF